jgi:hypothetical protein
VARVNGVGPGRHREEVKRRFSLSKFWALWKIKRGSFRGYLVRLAKERHQQREKRKRQ